MSYAQIVNVAGHSVFRERCRYAFVKAMISILNGTPSAGQIAYGKEVLQGTASVDAMVWAVLSNSTIAATIAANPGDGGVSVADSDMDFQVASAIPAFIAAGA